MVLLSVAVADFCCCRHYDGPWLESGWRSVIGFIEGTTARLCFVVTAFNFGSLVRSWQLDEQASNFVLI